MNSRDFYEILGVDENATQEEIEKAYSDKMTELYIRKNMGQITRDEFNQMFDELNYARDNFNAGYDDYEDEEEYDEEDEYRPRRKRGIGKKILTGAAVVAVAAAIFAGSYFATKLSGGPKSNQVGYEDYASGTVAPESDEVKPEDEKPEQSPGETEPGQEDPTRDIPAVVHYADIYDDAVVTERATALVNELKAANIINPTSGSYYTVEEVFALIKYANGVYTPETKEEIDVLHLNLLNILISPLNTDAYLYHVVYASGNDDFKDMAIEAANNIKPVNFASTFAEYEENGVYPLTLWMQQKREAIYSTTNRDEIEKIYVEVGQVMADIMKGNGCTITIYDDKQEFTYTYTSEQILANHASAMLLTIEAQLIFANKYEIRDANDKVVESSQTVWQVYNKFNGEEPDQVSLDEIEAWINNGCDYEWGIDEVLIDGQTFGQRIQGDMEGMALNNYAMSAGQSLTK